MQGANGVGFVPDIVWPRAIVEADKRNVASRLGW